VKMPSHGDQVITLQHLATHTSGLPRLPDNIQFKDLTNPYAAYTVDEMYEFLKGHKLAHAPGKNGEYSNLGMGLLGHLLAREAGTSYENLLHDRIAKPLHMTDTTISLNEEQRSRFAPPHMGDGQPAANWDIPTLAGAGAIRCTAGDMLKYAEANLSPPDGDIGKAINLAWELHQPPLEQSQFAMGLGWHIARDGQTRWHNGQTGGYHAVMYVNRPLEVGVVLLTNTATGEVDQLAEKIVQMLAGMPVEPPTFEKPVDVHPDILERYVGKFQLVAGVDFTVTTKDGKLFVGLTGQPTFEVYPRSETQWYYKVVKATLTFEVDDKGKCNTVELFQNGVRQKAKRIE
jgi:CubicO group peptidase (beta-lactamase class C family)